MTNLGLVFGVAGSKSRRIKKILLWTLLAAQICLIFCFWCIQTSNPEHAVNDYNGLLVNKKVINSIAASEKLKASPFEKAPAIKSRVNFVTKRKQRTGKNKPKEMQNEKFKTLENVSNFTRDFVEVKTLRLMNITEIEGEMANDFINMDTGSNVWCYRQGTINDTDGWQLYWNTDTQQAQCKCQKYWHGSDCGQNEVIYRALMLPRNQFLLSNPIKTQNSHLLVYMLEGYFFSLDFLELQIKPMTEIVDYFLIIWRGNQQRNPKDFKALKKKLDELLKMSRYMLYECGNQLNECNQTEAFHYFRTQLKLWFAKQLQSTDLLLHTNENILLSIDALRFFKYYASTQLRPWRFRLKYNVYGFFWQHPNQTYLDGFLSSFGQLDEPDRLTKLLSNHNNAEAFSVIGDLNHFGGWYCQYCAHPDEIITALNQTPNTILPTAFEKVIKQRDDFIQLPENSRNNLVIDTKYLEYLIAQGLQIDGMTRLQKVRFNTDAYYAPAYVKKLTWKFGNLLTNIFEALENDYVLDEAEGGFGF